jgi:hypothetical protein
MNLESRDAIKHAKQWLADMYADEKISDIGLEEVRWNNGNWEITLGFSRAWADNYEKFIAAAGLERPREYKVIVVSDADKSVVEMRNREAA